MTLTLKHSDTPLRDQIKRLYRHFRALRATKFWKNCIVGGAAFVEVKRSKNKQNWHPHLHVLCEGSFIDAGLLRSHWHSITGDSFIVDVRFVRDRGEVIRYIAKYASKPLDSTIYDEPEWLDEAIQSLHGVRLCTTVGSWRGVELEERPEDPGDWAPICSLTVLLQRVRDGDEPARALLATLKKNASDLTPLLESG